MIGTAASPRTSKGAIKREAPQAVLALPHRHQPLIKCRTDQVNCLRDLVDPTLRALESTAINAYLDTIKERLVTDPTIPSFRMICERSTLIDKHLRDRLERVDGSRLKFYEYMQRSPTGEIVVITYSHHGATANNELITRWDNIPHYPGLPGFPHHIHDGTTGEGTSVEPMSIFSVLNAIMDRIR